MEATVVVKDVTTKEGVGKKGPWKLWRVIDGNDDAYSTFSAGEGQKAEVLKGKKAVINYELDGDFKNLLAITEYVESKNGGRGWDDPVRQRSIILQSSLKVASETVNAAADRSEQHIPVDQRVKAMKLLAVELADWVEKWAMREAENIPFDVKDVPSD